MYDPFLEAVERFIRKYPPFYWWSIPPWIIAWLVVMTLVDQGGYSPLLLAVLVVLNFLYYFLIVGPVIRDYRKKHPEVMDD